MKFSTLAGSVGGGQQTPGFIGHSKFFIGSKKYIRADGGLKRVTWMPKRLKEELKDLLKARAEEEGMPDLLEKIADETIGITEEEVLEHCKKVGHPVLEMPPMM
jgi:acetyl-CoA synthase